MNEQLDRLVKLQDILSRRRELLQFREDLPRRLGEVRRPQEEQESQLAAAREAGEELGRERRRQEGELSMLEEKISRYKGQLLAVKTNREYAALKEEIRTAEQAQDALEVELLESMEASDTSGRDLAALQARAAEITEEVTRRVNQLESEASGIDDKLTELETELAAAREGIAADVLPVFLGLVESRAGRALVPVVDFMCTGCRVRIRPQVVTDLQRGVALHRCGSCRRFIYLEAPAPTDETDVADPAAAD